MALTAKEEVFKSIVKFVTHWFLNSDGVDKEPNYEKWLAEQVNAKKSKKKVEIPEHWKESWQKFWDTWPNTKSVPDDKGGWLFKSSAVMKSDEAGMFKKWLKAIESKKITIEQMQYAAECYLLYGYNKSKTLGQNKMEYESGMAPWLNQQKYLVYMNLEMPKEYKKHSVDTIDI